MSEHFGAVDYLVFIAMLVISTCIGFYYAWKDRKIKSNDEFLRGGKHMTVIPICLSIMASFIPSTGIIGFPVVIYATGTQFWITILPAMLAAVIACEVFIPIYYKMNLVSVNEYLHQRFKSHNLQVITNISTLISMIPFFAVELYAPAIALSIVTDLDISTSIVMIGLIVTLYTSLGGLKGVVWTDTMQFVLIFGGLIAVAVRGSDDAGGLNKAFHKAYQGGRIEFWNMNFNFYSLNSFWGFVLGMTTLWVGTFSTSQLQIQRAVCMPTLESAKKALYWAVPGFITILSIICLVGVLMYAKFYDCDPMLTGRVARPDQLLPYFVMAIFEEDYPGVPGLFVACVFGASLSTLSSGLNAMATIIWDDYAKNMLGFLNENLMVLAPKGIAILVGLSTLAVAFIVKETSSIVEAAVGLYGASNGPMLALFSMGLFCPWTNAIGGAAALISGQVFALWIVIGSIADKRDPRTMSLALSTDACAKKNITVYMAGAPLRMLKDYKIPKYDPTGAEHIHHISPYLVPIIGFLVAFAVGNIVSLLTKRNKDRVLDRNLINEKVCLLAENLLPKSWRQLQNEDNRNTNRNVVNSDLTNTLPIDKKVYYKTSEEFERESEEPVRTRMLPQNDSTEVSYNFNAVNNADDSNTNL